MSSEDSALGLPFRVLIASLFLAFAVVPLQDAFGQLVAHYEFEGNALDSAGDYHGVPHGGLSYAPGLFGQAARLDGVNDYIALPSFDAHLNYDEDWTISLWVKRQGKSNTFYSGGDGGSGHVQFSLARRVTKITKAAETVADWRVDHAAVADDVWSLYTVTWDASGRLAVYVDGQPVGEDTQGILADFFPDNYIPVLGAMNSGFDGRVEQFFTGLIDEFRIYDRALSTTEVRHLFEAQSDAKAIELSSASPNGDEQEAKVDTEGDPCNGCGCVEGSPGPILAATGNYTHTHTDFTIPSLGPDLAITRHYNNQDLYDGPFGHGWNMPLTARLVRAETADGTQTATIHMGNGVRRIFTQNPDGSWQPPTGQDDTLYAPDASTFVFNGECGTGCVPKPRRSYRFAFDGADFRLTEIADKNDNALAIAYDANGRIASTTDANGRSLTFAYNANNRIETVTDFAGRVWTYGYDADDNLTSVTDPLGHSVQYQYDDAHNLTAVLDANGHTQASASYDGSDKATGFTEQGMAYDLGYDPAQQLTTKLDPAAGLFQFRYDDNGNITEKTDALGNPLQLTWDANVDVTGKQNARGVATAYSYDAYHNLTQEIRDQGGLDLTTAYEYDPATGQVSRITDPRGVVTEMTYDANGNLDQVTRDVGGFAQTVDYTYDAQGLLLETVDADGIATAYEDDANGYLTRVYNPNVDPADPPIETTYTYDARGNRLTKTDANGNTTSYGYDLLDRLTSVTDALGNTTQLDYDAAGNLTGTTDPAGTVTELTYDEHNRLTARTEAVGTALERTTSYSYDARGNLETVTDPLGHTTRYTYDALNRQETACDHLDQCWSFAYDELGNLLTKTDPNGNATSYGYDAVNRLASVTDAEGHTTSYSYDGNGNLLTVTDANTVQATTNTYDALDRLTTSADGEGHTTQYSHTPGGRLQTRTTADGRVITHVYDPVTGRLTEIQYPSGRTESYGYDPVGNLLGLSDSATGLSVGYTYDALNRVETELQQGKTLTYSYDTNGNRIGLAVTDIGAYGYSYDALNRLTAITDPDAETTQFAYDAADRRTRITYGNGTYSDYAFDAANRLTAITHTKSDGTVLAGHGYSYDAMGNRLTETDASGATVVSYTYDATYKLLTATYADTGEVIAFSYDGTGNRLSRSDDTGTATYAYDAANRLTTQSNPDGGSIAYSFDDAGRIQSQVKTNPDTSTETTSYTYDEKDQLVELAASGAVTLSFTYDPTGRRVTETAAATKTFLYDGQNPLAELESVGNPTVTYTPGLQLDLLASRKAGSGAMYYLRDGINSVRGMVDAGESLTDTYLYQPYGEVRTRTGSSANAFTFTGRRSLPGTGIMYYRSRYYDPGVGRFLKKDAYEGSINSPPSIHRYTYVHNNPGNYTDPEGEFAWVAAGAIVGGVAGAVYGGYSAYKDGGSAWEVTKSALAWGAGGAVVGAAVSAGGVWLAHGGAAAVAHGATAAGKVIVGGAKSVAIGAKSLGGKALTASRIGLAKVSAFSQTAIGKTLLTNELTSLAAGGLGIPSSPSMSGTLLGICMQGSNYRPNQFEAGPLTPFFVRDRRESTY